MSAIDITDKNLPDLISHLRKDSKFIQLEEENAALRKELQELREQKPVAWIEHHKGGDNLSWDEIEHSYAKPSPLYAASVPASEWISVEDRLPECDLTPNSFGTPVLVYPPFKDHGTSEMTQIFYGCRQHDNPEFYIFGRAYYDVTHWMPLPAAPKEPA